MKLTYVLACATIFTMSLEAQRQGRGRGRGGSGLNAEVLKTLLEKYDKNDDGKIDRKEYPRGDTAFTNLDRDKNGAIEEADLTATRQRGRGRGNRGRGDRTARPKVPEVGEVAPDFDLPLAEQATAPKGKTAAKDKKAPKGKTTKEKTVKLSSFAGKKPVALIFGSYT